MIEESYQKLGNDSFDVAFWQKHGPQKIFEAAYDMIRDYLLIKENHADEPRIQRTIERFSRR